MPHPVYQDNWTFVQGETITRHYTFTNPDASPFNLTGYTVSCQFRKTWKSPVIVEASVPLTGPATSGALDLVVSDVLSAGVTADEVVYDIKATHPTLGTVRLVKGTCPVDHSVTRDE